MVFHGIAAGECYARRDADGETRHLGTGDVLVLTRGDAHTITSEPGGEGTPINHLPRKTEHGLALVHSGTAGAETRIVCGTFDLDHPAQSTVVGLLPPLITGKPQGDARRRWSMATVSLLEEELRAGSPSAHATSLADSLFVAALADTAATATGPSSLLAAARDERIGRALCFVHADPARDWSAATLGASVGMSRTRFFQRFTELVGEPPARYIARWRALIAADLLKKRTMSTTAVAEQVGYSDEDALAKVFKRYMGMTPAEYRRSEPH